MNPTLLTIASVAALFAITWGLAMASHMRSRERVRCPERKTEFDVELERRLGASWGPGKKLDVLQCTAFDDPGHVACAKACLR